MRSVNLDSIQDFSQIPAQKVEQNFGANETPSKDFFSMLSEQFEKLGESNAPERAETNSAAVQHETNRKETPAAQKEIAEKRVSSETNSSGAEEKTIVHEEKKGGKNAAAISEGKKNPRGKNRAADDVLQGAEAADASSVKKYSAKQSERLAEKKAARTERATHFPNDFQFVAQAVSETTAEHASDLESLRVGLSKKQFLSEAVSSARETDSLSEEPFDAETISALQLSPSQIQNADAPAFASALKGADGFSSEHAHSVKPKREVKIGVIEVKDLRTNAEVAQAEAKDFKKDFVRAVQNDTNGSGIELTMDVASNSEKNILSLDSQSAAADGSNFQAMLKNQITQNAGEFVRAGNIILRDNDSGTINLVLHPESLGNVKIGLELSGKTIMGHIIVASREAFNAFGDGADVLRNAFIQSGFDDAKFDVSFAGSEMQFAQQNRGGQDDGSSMRQGKKIYGEFVEENSSVAFENADKNRGTVVPSSYSIDVVA